MRDRLIELLQNFADGTYTSNGIIVDGTKVDDVADYLIANGVIVPPCKVGDTVYVIKRCRCGKPQNYELRQCHKKIIQSTPKFLDRVMVQETGRRLKPEYFGKLEWEDAPKGTICYSIYAKPFDLKMLTEIGKTVFLTKEEAEKALKGGAE